MLLLTILNLIHTKHIIFYFCYAFQQSVWPRGKVLGGSSVLNYMLYVRGNRKDYDQWDSGLGCAGWSWKEVFPYFLKSENNRDPDILAGGYVVRTV